LTTGSDENRNGDKSTIAHTHMGKTKRNIVLQFL